MSAQPSDDLDIARRRIEQLEAALMRRTELLERKTAELANVKASRVYKAANGFQKLFNKGFPIHTRRRAFARSSLRSIFGLARWAMQARQARNGPPPEERFLSESVPPDEYRRWINRWEPKPADLARQRHHRFARSPKISIVVPVFNPPPRFLDAMIQSVLAQTYPELGTLPRRRQFD